MVAHFMAPQIAHFQDRQLWGLEFLVPFKRQSSLQPRGMPYQTQIQGKKTSQLGAVAYYLDQHIQTGEVRQKLGM